MPPKQRTRKRAVEAPVEDLAKRDLHSPSLYADPEPTPPKPPLEIKDRRTKMIARAVAAHAPDYDPSFARLIDAEYLGSGTETDLAKFLEVPHRLIGEWMSAVPDFDDAVRRARRRADDLVVEAIMRKTIGYKYTEVDVKEWTDKEGDEHEIRTTKFREMAPSAGDGFKWLEFRQPEEWARSERSMGEDDVPFFTYLARELAERHAIEAAAAGVDRIDHNVEDAEVVETASEDIDLFADQVRKTEDDE